MQSLRSVAWLSSRMRDNEVDEQLARLDSGGDAVRFAWWVGSKMPMEERRRILCYCKLGYENYIVSLDDGSVKWRGNHGTFPNPSLRYCVVCADVG